MKVSCSRNRSLNLTRSCCSNTAGGRLMQTYVGLLGVIMGTWAFLGLLAVADTQAPGKTQKVPDSLVDVGEFGENIYDHAKAKDWSKAGEKLDALKGAVKKMAGELKDAKAANK